MKATKKIVSLLLAAATLLSLAACGKTNNDPVKSGGSQSTSVSTGGETVKERLIIADSDTLTQTDPQTNNSIYNRRVYEMTHDTLVNYNPTTGETYAGLAKSWDVSDDNLEYTFHLNEGVKFHNGDDCTAEDVVYTFERARNSSVLESTIANLEKVEAVDPNTVKMTMSKANVEWLITLSMNALVILDKDAIDADPDKGTMVGTGPYVFTEWMPGDYVLVTRNDNYFGELPKSKEIMYKRVPEASARVIALQTGEVDVCLEVPAIEATHVSDAKNCQLVQLASTKTMYAGLNVSGVNKDVLDVRVRQAFNYATDPETLILAMTEGYGQPAHGVIPSNVWGYYDGVKTYTYDVEKAKQLLAEAGHPDGIDITLTYKASNSAGLFEVLQDMWGKAGIRLTLSTDDGTVASEQLRANTYDIYASQISMTALGEYLMEFWHSSSSANRTKTAEPELDAMIEEVQTISDPTERKAKFAEISQYLTDYAAMIPFYVDTLLIGVRDNVDGLVLYGTGRHEFTYAYATE